ncbi:hypothetical protein MYX64_01560 [Nitrospinae bacterium AH_259_B05_G02_I21]|nr:hypothetical protein [Nitrospinae bacterium AH_259_B05_G02_I21]
MGSEEAIKELTKAVTKLQEEVSVLMNAVNKLSNSMPSSEQIRWLVDGLMAIASKEST